MTADRKTRRALGRGLDALLPARSPRPELQQSATSFSCPIERIAPRRDQPRSQCDPAALDALAATIREHGVLQPLLVRRTADDRYEIIAGERRWRAAQRAGHKEVPVVVKEASSAAAFEMALIENLQREDLNPMEVAEGYQKLLDDGGHTQARLAEAVGKSRVAITNALRLLKLPEPVRTLLRSGELTEGHGRALLGASNADEMIAIATRAARGRLSVRQIERQVRRANTTAGAGAPAGSGASGSGATSTGTKSAAVRDLEVRLSRRLSARTQVEHQGPGGKLVIRYHDLDALDRIIELIGA